jgi:hypothetical protein
MRKNSAVCQKYVFTATINKIRIKISCLEIYIRKSSDDNCLQNPINHGKIHRIFFSAGFQPLLSKLGGRTAAKFSRPIIYFIRSVLCYFAEFSAGWQQCTVSVKCYELRTGFRILAFGA